MRYLNSGWLIAGFTLLAAMALPFALQSTYTQSLVVLACVFSLLGLSTNLMFGYLGYTAFGQAAFFGLGAYTAVLSSQHLGISYWAAAVLAMSPGIGLGILIGFASLRVGGAYFAITSLTVAEILRLLADNWISLTHGPMGVVVQRPTIPFLTSELGLTFPQYYLGIVVLITGAAFWLVSRLLDSPVGRAWKAFKESHLLAESVGIATLRYRIANIALSGALASLAGALLVPKILVISPDLFGASYSATALLIVVLGGQGSLLGSVIGGALFALVPELLRFVDEFRMAIFAVLLLVVVRVKPDGLVAFIPLQWRQSNRSIVPDGSTAVPIVPASVARNSQDLTKHEPVSVEAKNVVLEVTGLSKMFRGLVAVDAVSFSVNECEIVGLMGPNGAGKTTCLSMVSGFLEPSAGSVRFAGALTGGQAPHQLARRGLVRTFQHTTLFPQLSALENVLLATHLCRNSSPLSVILGGRRFRDDEAARRALSVHALDQVGLRARSDTSAGSLAYGEQRLLAIALALAAKPRLLLLDEPAAGMNPAEADYLAQILLGLRSAGMTIVLVEHNVPMMMSICDRLVVLHHGTKIAEGTPAEVQSDAAVRDAYFGSARTPVAPISNMELTNAPN